MSSTNASSDQSSLAREGTHAASEAAAALLHHMDERGSTGGAPVPQEGHAASSQASPRPAIRDRVARGEACTKEELEEVRKIIVVQDQIIASIQQDNESMRIATKQMQSHTKEVESKLAHLEAKHSLMLSARESPSSGYPLEVSKLVAKNKELQRSLENAEVRALSAAAETRKLLSELERMVGMEEQISSMRTELKQRELKHEAEVHALKEQLAAVASAEEGRKAPNPTNVSVTSIDYVEIEHDRAGIVSSLQQRIKELEGALRRQNDKAVAELMQSVEERGKTQSTSRLEARIQQLEDALCEKDVCMERMVERLRTESNNVRTGYEATIAKLEAQLRQAQLSRTAEADGKLLQKEEARESANSGAQAIAADQLRAQADASCREREELVQRAAAREAELDSYKKLLEESRILLRNSSEAWEQRSIAFKDDFLRQLRDIRQRHNEDIDRLQREHREEMTRALDELSEIKQSTTRCEPLRICASDNGGSEETARTFLENVLRRLEYLEQHCLRREKECALEVAEAKRAARSEMLAQREKYEMLLAQKNRQLGQFRSELDDMIASISSLRHSARP